MAYGRNALSVVKAVLLNLGKFKMYELKLAGYGIVGVEVHTSGNCQD